jgi:23S rRNA (guanosine2251-2'-O)-methyltransferase
MDERDDRKPRNRFDRTDNGRRSEPTGEGHAPTGPVRRYEPGSRDRHGVEQPHERPAPNHQRDAGDRPPPRWQDRRPPPPQPGASRRPPDRAPRPLLPADIVTGAHAAEALARLQPERVRELYLWGNDAKFRARIEDLATANSLRLVPQPPPGLTEEGPNPQGVAVRVTPFRYADLDSLVPVQGAADGTLVLVLDSITDPRNLGAILRSAAFFQATCVVLPTDRAAEVTSLVERIAEGGSAAVPVVQVVNLSRTLASLRERGVQCIGTVLDGAEGDLRSHAWSPATALVLGAEGLGIRPLVRKNCDILLGMPGPETMQSLNVAAFATLALALARGAAPARRA